MMHRFRYIGCFVDPIDLEEKLSHIPRRPLKRAILNPHVTVAYRPETVDLSLFGMKVRLRITDYGRDENNEGVRVELFAEDPRLAEQFQTVKVPHITLSVSEAGEAVNTRDLRFEAVKPVELFGVYGGYTEEHEVITHPLEP